MDFFVAQFSGDGINFIEFCGQFSSHRGRNSGVLEQIS